MHVAEVLQFLQHIVFFLPLQALSFSWLMLFLFLVIGLGVHGDIFGRSCWRVHTFSCKFSSKSGALATYRGEPLLVRGFREIWGLKSFQWINPDVPSPIFFAWLIVPFSFPVKAPILAQTSCLNWELNLLWSSATLMINSWVWCSIFSAFAARGENFFI